MQSFTLAQLERAIQYWRRHHDRTRLYHNSSDGARQEQLLTALYGRMVEQRLGAIDLDQISSAEAGERGLPQAAASLWWWAHEIVTADTRAATGAAVELQLAA